jgi:hypothetical protein
MMTSEDVARVAEPLIGHARTERVLLLIYEGGFRLKRTEIVATGRPSPARCRFGKLWTTCCATAERFLQ